MEKLNKEKYLKRVIVLCWAALFVSLAFKLFGAKTFEIFCNNERFIAVCEYAGSHFWAKYLIGCIYCFISLYFFLLAIMQKWKFERWQLIVVIATVLVGTAIKIISTKYGLIFDIWQFLILPCILSKKPLIILISNILLIAFQLLSMFTRNIQIQVLANNVLIGNIFSIDIIIMLVLYYIYSNIKEN